MIEFPSAAADRAVVAALEEDAAACDLTTQWSVPDGLVSEATIISRAHGIIAGLQLVDLVMHHIDPSSVLSLTSPPSPTSASTSSTPQNRTRAQSAGQIRGPGRWRHQPPHEPRRDGAAQGQPRRSRRRRHRRQPGRPLARAGQLPSDILQAEVAAKGAFSGLFLGLGAVALLVGGVGIANVMVISVLERRSEIGLRRALGATRRHVAEQFLAEALLLSLLGGLAGTMPGVAATAMYAATQHWQVQIPALAFYGVGAALAIGGIAGLYPLPQPPASHPRRHCVPHDRSPRPRPPLGR